MKVDLRKFATFLLAYLTPVAIKKKLIAQVIEVFWYLKKNFTLSFNRPAPVPAKMQWCTACAKISTKDCDQKNHEHCDLDSEEGAMMAETHFKLHLMNCKKSV